MTTTTQTHHLKTAGSTLAGLLLGASMMSPASAAEHNVTIGLNNWAESIAVANMWKLLLEDEHDYSVKLTDAGKSVIFSGVANNDFDLSLEIWLPITDEQYLEPYKDRIDVQDSWYEGAGLGLVVPSYADIDSIPELKSEADSFTYQGRPVIVGIESGSAIAGLTNEAIETYDLPMDQMNSSGPAMMAALNSAVAENRDLVVTLWSPHWAFSEYDLKYLDDPEGVFGENENIYWFSRKDFADDDPWLTALLNAWQMDDDSLGSLMAQINELGDPEDGARAWIKDNRELIDGWVEEANAAVETN